MNPAMEFVVLVDCIFNIRLQVKVFTSREKLLIDENSTPSKSPMLKGDLHVNISSCRRRRIRRLLFNMRLGQRLRLLT